MIQGVSSWAGKSLLTTAIARLLSRRGLAVAPFKAVNMSNNARVVDGGEIGAAQYLQALAAGVVPDVRMNPVLVKPEGDRRSQVVLRGVADQELSRMEWRKRADHLWPAIEESLESLGEQFEFLVLEGAGSPAEINLRSVDLANMRVARHLGARVALVANIDRGGAFAHLYGTWSLLAPEERDMVAGFVLNKFRGDPALLAPGPDDLRRMTGVPTAGVIPWLDHSLPDEDGVAHERRARHGDGARPVVAVLCYPAASNLDEFKLLEQVADVAYTRNAAELARANLVVLPGSKHVATDLAWLRERGLDRAVAAAIDGPARVVAICGGMQMLGHAIHDPVGVEAAAQGLGLIDAETQFEPAKRVRRTQAEFSVLPPPWQALTGMSVTGYEIRYGSTIGRGLHPALPDGLGYSSGNVLGVYLHGLFEHGEFVSSLLGVPAPESLDDAIDHLADAVDEHLDLDALLLGRSHGAEVIRTRKLSWSGPLPIGQAEDELQT